MISAPMRPKAILLSTAVAGVLIAASLRFTTGPGAEPISRILTLAVLGVVPLALLALESTGTRWDRLLPAAAVALPVCGGSAVISLWLPRGPAGPWTTPWMGFAVFVAIMGAARVLPSPGEDRTERRIEHWVSAIGLAYLAVGAGWLVIFRAGLAPLGFGPVVVALTAVHFHFAGLAAPVIAVRTMGALDGRARTLAQAAGVGVIAAIPIVAIGLSISALVALVGTALLATALITLAVLMVLRVQRRLYSRTARVLLIVSAISATLSMPLAVYYQWGQLSGDATIDLEWMIRLHGFANAHGFATCGLIAWVLEDRTKG